jgi:hypothetical protein
MARRTYLAGITAAAWTVAIAAAGPAPQPEGSKSHPALVLLIRHAEKPPDEAVSVSLSPQGRKRADALPGLFTRSQARPVPFPAPQFLFATKNSKHSHRPVETVTPLAVNLGLRVHAEIADEDFAKVAGELFGKTKYAGKTVLICWHHATLPDLAHALGATDAPGHFKGSVFDRVWQISYDDQGEAAFTDLPQRLLPGDSDR